MNEHTSTSRRDFLLAGFATAAAVGCSDSTNPLLLKWL